jgi:hypothetical protein
MATLVSSDIALASLATHSAADVEARRLLGDKRPAGVANCLGVPEYGEDVCATIIAHKTGMWVRRAETFRQAGTSVMALADDRRLGTGAYQFLTS